MDRKRIIGKFDSFLIGSSLQSVSGWRIDSPINGEGRFMTWQGGGPHSYHTLVRFGPIHGNISLRNSMGISPLKEGGQTTTKTGVEIEGPIWTDGPGGRDVNQSLTYDYYRSTKSLGNNVIVLIIIDSAIISCIASYCWWCAIFSSFPVHFWRIEEFRKNFWASWLTMELHNYSQEITFSSRCFFLSLAMRVTINH